MRTFRVRGLGAGLLTAAALSALAAPAFATSGAKAIDYPGSSSTQVTDINNNKLRNNTLRSTRPTSSNTMW